MDVMNNLSVMVIKDVETAIDEEREAEAMNIAERAVRFARLKTLVTALRVTGHLQRTCPV